jgi:hypothetical protein
MDINFTCNQVESLLNYYIDGKLAPSLAQYVTEHIKKCPKCRKKIEQLKNVMLKYNNENNSQNTKETDSELIGSLSAYIDNELDTTENVKIKIKAISNPSARQKLESMYKFQKLIHSAYEKTKNETKFDYSKSIMAIINDTPDYSTTYFRSITIMFILILTAIIIGFIYLYF